MRGVRRGAEGSCYSDRAARATSLLLGAAKQHGPSRLCKQVPGFYSGGRHALPRVSPSFSGLLGPAMSIRAQIARDEERREGRKAIQCVVYDEFVREFGGGAGVTWVGRIGSRGRSAASTRPPPIGHDQRERR